jgi:hypothetical protein
MLCIVPLLLLLLLLLIISWLLLLLLLLSINLLLLIPSLLLLLLLLLVICWLSAGLRDMPPVHSVTMNKVEVTHHHSISCRCVTAPLLQGVLDDVDILLI